MDQLKVGACILTLFMLACDEKPVAMSRQLTPQPLRVESFENMGEYVRMIHLETHPDALLGGVDKVIVDPSSGDLLVMDRKINRAVFRFDGTGKFLYRYGKKGQGPGEYEKLMTFTLLENGRLALFSQSKRIIYEADGRFVREKPCVRNDFFAEAKGNRIYVYSVMGLEDTDLMVSVLDENLSIIDQFHDFEKRLQRVPMIPHNAIAHIGDQIAVAGLCDYQISLYDQRGELVDKAEFPNQNQELEPLWNMSAKKLKEPRNVYKIMKALHRAEAIYNLGRHLYILERQQGAGVMRSNLWDPETDQVYAFTDIRLVRAPEEADYLSMSNLAGAYEDQLIGVVTDPDLFARFQTRYPVAQDIHYGDSDNPVLAFFRFKDPAPLQVSR